MEFIKIFGVIAVGLVFVVVIKGFDTKMAVWVNVATVIVVLIYSVNALGPVIELVNLFSGKIENGGETIVVLVKISVVNIVSYALSVLCSECGEKSLVSVIETVSDVICLGFALPMLNSIYGSIMSLLGG